MSRIAFGIAISLAAILFILFVATATTSRIIYSEFSPNTFQTRTMIYARVPVVKWIFSPSSSISTNYPLSLTVNLLKHLKTIPPPDHWHLVDVTQANHTDSYPALLLVKQLSITDENRDVFWDVWSQKNEPLASELWPLVQELAMKEQYLTAHHLLSLAKDAKTKEEIQSIYKKLTQ